MQFPLNTDVATLRAIGQILRANVDGTPLVVDDLDISEESWSQIEEIATGIENAVDTEDAAPASSVGA